MNADPHTHDLRHRAPGCDHGSDCKMITVRLVHCFTYGDTRKHVHRWMLFIPLRWRLERAVKALVQEHDQGSIKAGKKSDKTQFVYDYVSQFRYATNMSSRTWASELEFFKEKEGAK